MINEIWFVQLYLFHWTIWYSAASVKQTWIQCVTCDPNICHDRNIFITDSTRGCHNTDLSLLWHHNGHDGISNHQPHDCLLNCLFRRRSKKTSKLHVTGEFLAQRASNTENVSIGWRHHDVATSDEIQQLLNLSASFPSVVHNTTCKGVCSYLLHSHFLH